jgi:hypothetical protein
VPGRARGNGIFFGAVAATAGFELFAGGLGAVAFAALDWSAGLFVFGYAFVVVASGVLVGLAAAGLASTAAVVFAPGVSGFALPAACAAEPIIARLASTANADLVSRSRWITGTVPRRLESRSSPQYLFR